MPITRTITIGSKRKTRTKAPAEPSFKRKPNPKGKHLVVVESPAKAKTIEKILGPDYKVLASKGHLRDLPQKTLGVDIDDNFKPEYVNSKDKEDVIKTLQKEANHCRDIYLATDPDREGEAISWHLAKLLDVNPEDNVRIAFHEITAPAIKEAIKHPGPIDLNRVDAQQARRRLSYTSPSPRDGLLSRMPSSACKKKHQTQANQVSPLWRVKQKKKKNRNK